MYSAERAGRAVVVHVHHRDAGEARARRPRAGPRSTRRSSSRRRPARSRRRGCRRPRAPSCPASLRHVGVVPVPGAGLLELGHADADDEGAVAHAVISFCGSGEVARALDGLEHLAEDGEEGLVEQRAGLAAGQTPVLEPLEAGGLGQAGVGARHGAQLGRGLRRVVAWTERLDHLVDRVLAGLLEDRLDVGVAAEALRSSRGDPGLAVAAEHLEPAVDALGQEDLGVAPVDLGRHRLERHRDHRAHGLEVELALGAEVVVDQAPGHAGGAGDLGGGNRSEVALGEEPARGGEDLRAALVVREAGPAGGCCGHAARRVARLLANANRLHHDAHLNDAMMHVHAHHGHLSLTSRLS